MMKLEGLEAFVAVAETGSIGRAAKRLGLSTSVVSERLARLEQSLGVALVHRTTRKLTLTEDGQTFRPRAAGVLQEVAAAAAELVERSGGLSGPLRLSAPLSFGVLHLGPALFPFLRENPGIELSLDLDDRFVDVAGDGYDAVIRIGQVSDNRLVAHRLAESRRVLVASPEYLERHGTPQSLGDLQQHRAIRYALRGADDWRFRKDEAWTVVRPPMSLRVNNGDLMRGAAEAGLGIALLPTFIVAQAVAEDKLLAIEVGAEPELDTVHIVYTKHRGVPNKVRALVESLKSSFGEPAYWDVAIDQVLGSAALQTNRSAE